MPLLCGTCPAKDCQDRDDQSRACLPSSLQSGRAAALTHSSPRLPILLDQLDDFAIPPALPSPSEQPLPLYLPQIDPDMAVASRVPDTAALTLRRFISRGGREYGSGIRRAQKLRSMGARTLVLVLVAFDDQLEAVARDPTRFLDAVQEAGFDLVIGPAFSIYTGRSPLERNANRSRNLAIYAEIVGRVVAAIPSVGYADTREAEYAARWIARLQLTSVFVDYQSVEHEWDEAREALSALAASDFLRRIVVNGVAHPQRVIDLRRAVPHLPLIITNSHALQLARSHRDYVRLETGSYARVKSPAPPPEIFRHLCAFYAAEPMAYEVTAAQYALL